MLTKVEGADAAKLSSAVKHYATSHIAPTIQPDKTEVSYVVFSFKKNMIQGLQLAIRTQGP